MPEANSDHIVAVVAKQRDQFLNALTVSEINNAALTARVAELEEKLAKADAKASVEPASSKAAKKT